MTQLLAASEPALQPAPQKGTVRRPSATGALFLLTVLVVANLPLFLCMPLATDVVYYDMQAENILHGGVHYRDLFEPNLPGIVWLHAAIRSVLGLSSEAMRLAGFGSLVAIAWLLARWLKLAGHAPRTQAWTALCVFWFVFSISEWSHCQRDTWMLVPALIGLHLRSRQIERLKSENASGSVAFQWAFLEGLCWASGFWIKPFIAVPALACCVVSAMSVRRAKLISLDIAGLLCGGLLIGSAGIAWMWQTNAWPYFIDTFLHWNPDYVQARKEGWTGIRVLATAYRFFPWSLLHLAAVPVALATLIRWMRAGSCESSESSGGKHQTLLAAFYLGWLAQSVSFQHLFDYVHAPGMILAIAVLANRPRAASWKWKLATVAFLFVAAATSPALRPARLSDWWNCVTQGSTPELRDRLSLFDQVEWQNLEKVATFLRSQNLREGELTCYNSTLVYLYPQLGLKPSTRYALLDMVFYCSPSHRRVIYEDVVKSPQRFVVTDIVDSGLSIEQGAEPGREGPLSPPPAYPKFKKSAYPWSLPIVFRAGRYLVHRVEQPVGPLLFNLPVRMQSAKSPSDNT